MLDWLKKASGSKPWQNKVGLDEQSLGLLVEDFARLESRWPGLSERILTYVLDGTGAEVLAELAALEGVGLELGLTCSKQVLYDSTITRRPRCFSTVDGPEAEFFVRLGKTYEAATRLPRRQLCDVFADPQLDWLEVFLWEATHLAKGTHPPKFQAAKSLNAQLIQLMLQAEGVEPERFLRALAVPNVKLWFATSIEPLFTSLACMGDWVSQQPSAFLEALNHPEMALRLRACKLLEELGANLGPFVGRVVELTVSSKTFREQSLSWLEQNLEVVRRPLEEQAIGANPEGRAQAARLLKRLYGKNARAFLQKRKAEEKTASVLEALEQLLPSDTQPVTPLPELPPLAPRQLQVPLGAETFTAWQGVCAELNQRLAAQVQTPRPSHSGPPPVPLTPAVVADLFRRLQEPWSADSPPKRNSLWRSFAADGDQKLFKVFFQRPEMQLPHLLRFLALRGDIDSQRPDQQYALNRRSDSMLNDFRRHHPEFGLRELAQQLTEFGLSPEALGVRRLEEWYARDPFQWESSAVWPYWAEHLDLLEAAFQLGSDYGRRGTRSHAFAVLASFPQVPGRLLPLLWELALGPKSERAPAQHALATVPDKRERLLAAVRSSKAETRAAAAEWLGRLQETEAVPALLAALKKEKNEATKSALMSALEHLGVPVEQFLDRAGLLQEAYQALAKGIPEDLKWFCFGQLPAVHWQDSGELVPREVVQYWLLQSFRLKAPEPGPLLRRYCAGLKPTQREALGQFVLESWLAEDTAAISSAEAENKARQAAQRYVLWQQSSYWPASTPKKTLAEHYAALLPGFLKEPKGSAIASKGVLAVAAACGGAAATPVVSRYLKEWYGMRGPQCRALLQMLVWVEHPTAIQLLLAVGSRFRTKGIQEEANRQAQTLAERKGWTLEELADRTIPSAGLDEQGEMELDFGLRKFRVRLTEEVELALSDAEGKPLKALPEPRQDDDEAKAKEAKKQFSAAKKELKTVLQMQRERLYEAMCTQRQWSFEDWNLYLNQHPILRHYCQRLVWSVVKDGKTSVTFRPLPDGSLTDAQDSPVQLQPQDAVQLSHESNVPAEQSQLWQQHLADYEVEPLFEQFGKQTFALGEDKKQENEICDFQGHLLEAFRLRGRATKLGYTRGRPQDGGWFADYHKRFPTLGINAVIEFTGNSLPEENRTVALTKAYFQRAGVPDESAFGGNERVALGEVPVVLLTECWNDLRAIAAEGSGFDPDWQEKAQL